MQLLLIAGAMVGFGLKGILMQTTCTPRPQLLVQGSGGGRPEAHSLVAALELHRAQQRPNPCRTNS